MLASESEYGKDELALLSQLDALSFTQAKSAFFNFSEKPREVVDKLYEMLIEWLEENLFIQEIEGLPILHLEENEKIAQYLMRNQEAAEKLETLKEEYYKKQGELGSILDKGTLIADGTAIKKKVDEAELVKQLESYLRIVEKLVALLLANKVCRESREFIYKVALSLYKLKNEKLTFVYFEIERRSQGEKLIESLDKQAQRTLLSVTPNFGRLFYEARKFLANEYLKKMFGLSGEVYLMKFMLFMIYKKQGSEYFTVLEKKEIENAATEVYQLLEISRSQPGREDEKLRLCELIVEGFHHYYGYLRSLYELSGDKCDESLIEELREGPSGERILRPLKMLSYFRRFLSSYIPPKLSQVQSSELQAVLQLYQGQAQSDPDVLRRLIPAEEVWRIFIDGDMQASGRQMRDTPMLNNKKQRSLFSPRRALFDLTINDYLKEVEHCEKVDEFSYIQTQLGRLLTKESWLLTQEMRANLSLNDILALDKGWIPFEINEPDYLKALIETFNSIFTRRSELLSTQLIMDLHQQAVRGVKNTNYQYPDLPGVRDTSIGFTLLENSTEEGLRECVRRHDLHSSISLVQRKKGGRDRQKFKLPSCQSSSRLLKTMLKELDDEPRKVILALADAKDDASYSSILFRHRRAGIDRSYVPQVRLFDFHYRFLFSSHWDSDYGLESRRMRARKEGIEARLNLLTHRFNRDIKNAVSPEDKLFFIVSYIQDCEQLHPFQDANCRTFCMVLLNFLLIQQGFPFVVLKDPNCFDMFSRRELMMEVVHGMRRTMELAEGKKNLFGFNMAPMLRFLKSKPFLRSQFLEPFEQLVRREEENRQAIPLSCGARFI